jgi:hypothetical protein
MDSNTVMTDLELRKAKLELEERQLQLDQRRLDLDRAKLEIAEQARRDPTNPARTDDNVKNEVTNKDAADEAVPEDSKSSSLHLILKP